MNSLNLFALSTISNPDDFVKLELQLSQRFNILKPKPHEIISLSSFVKALLDLSPDLEIFDNFYYSYEIPQIGKEFDLLKIAEEATINIELKSTSSNEDIQKQLIKNKYYLSHLNQTLYLYTFESDSKKLYKLDDCDQLIEVNLIDLLDSLGKLITFSTRDINNLFSVSNFLVSPLNTPEKFLENRYFLTPQQENFKKDFIKKCFKSDKYNFFGITGAAGTGKTLFLYDLAKTCAKKGKCCMIHCGVLCAGHLSLNKQQTSIKIFDAKSIKSIIFSNYKYIFVDEGHRIYKNQFEEIINATKKYSLTTTFAFDGKQVLSNSEIRANISDEYSKLSSDTIFKLSNKIRTNPELSSFFQKLFYLKFKDNVTNYPSVSIVYANDEREAFRFISIFQKKDYIFLNYTESSYYPSTLDKFTHLSYANTHRVIGQEFNNVVMVLDSNFYYDSNQTLKSKKHPNPNYLYDKLLYQGLTRVRSKLALVVVRDYPLFQSILSILQ